MNRRCISTLLTIAMVFCITVSNSYSQPAQWEWARSFSTGGWEVAWQAAVDEGTQEVCVIGTWTEDLSGTFPGGTNPSTQFNSTYGWDDGFVAKYDQNGNLLWAFKVGGDDDDEIFSVDIDQDGNIYITGYMGPGANIYFSGTSPHTGSSTLSNSSDLDFFIAKYNPDGEFIWVRRSETNSGDLVGWDVTLSPDAVYAVGTYNGLATFGSLPMSNAPDGEDIFLVKYSLDGVEQWIAEAGSNANDIANGVIADENHVYYTGSFRGSNLIINDGGGGSVASIANANSGTEDIIIASYDADGNFNWARTISSTNREIGYGITMDTDSIYLTGTVNNNATFPNYDGNPVFTSGDRDPFISSHAKSDGSTGWVSVLYSNDPGVQSGKSIVTDGNGILYTIGDYTVDLFLPKAGYLAAEGDKDIYLASYTTLGEFRWAVDAGSVRNEDGHGITAGSDGSIYIAGMYEDQMTLGTLTLPDDDSHNGYLARLKESSPPVNDDPCSAVFLMSGDTCNALIFDNHGSSDSGIPDPGCGEYAGGDIWFKAVIPPSGNLFIGTDLSDDDTYPPDDGWMYRVEMAAYSGNCESLNLEGCYSHTSGYHYRASSAYLFDKNPGDTIWIRVWESFGNEFGNFSICTYDPGHYPAWEIPETLCGNEGIIDLDTSLAELTVGFVDNLMGSMGVPDPGDAVGTPDAASARLFDNGDWIRLDLTDTIPAGEAYILYFRSNTGIDAPTQLSLWASDNNVDYFEHSYKPETDRDEVTSHYIIAEHPTRYLYIENDNAGGGGFAVDGIKYFYRGTRGGTWSGPGITGSMLDPAALSGLVSITYTVGGSTTSTDSTRSTMIYNSDGGTLSPDTAVCEGSNNVSMDLTNFNGDILSWESSEDGFSSIAPISHTSSSYTIADLTQTTAFRVIVQDGSCTPDTSNAVLIEVLENPLADAGNGSAVCGFSAGLQAIPSIGTGSWSAISGPGTPVFSPSENDPLATVTVDQEGSYEILWTESNGLCYDMDTVTIDFYQQPVSDPGSGGVVCGLEFALNAVPSADTGYWSMTSGPGNAIFSTSAGLPDASVSVTQPGTYEFTWTVSNAMCSDQNTIRVDFLEFIEVDAGMGGDVCGLEFNLNAVSVGGSGQWSKVAGPGNIVFSPSDTSVSVSVIADEYGDYLFQWLETLDECTGSDTVAVGFYMPPVPDAGPDQVLEFVFSTYLNASIPEFGTGHWEVVRGSGQFADENDALTQVTELQLGENEFTWIIQSIDCEDVSDNVIITVNDIYKPTVITPNNDGQNDFLVFSGVEQQSSTELIIYNRWGTEVYRSIDYKNDWEGLDHKGRDLIPDTYFYILKIASQRIIKGFVEIRR